MARYIANPFGGIPKNPKSHVRGWSEYWAEMLKAEVYSGDFSNLSSKDTVFIDHGVNFSGGMNLFGGLTDKVAQRLCWLSTTRPKLVSLDITMPDYPGMLTGRLGKNSTSPLFTVDVLNRLTPMFKEASWTCWRDVTNNHLTIGDSHSTAFAPAGSSVLRENGRTLHGFLKDPRLPEHLPKSVTHVTLVYGSVDIRHHVSSKGGARLVQRLWTEYTDFAGSWADLMGITVELAAPVPVEYSGRRIPKTGWHDGKPFNGCVEDRRFYTDQARTILNRSLVRSISPPYAWYTMDPEIYAKEYMELTSSVHISPVHYRIKGTWNV